MDDSEDDFLLCTSCAAKTGTRPKVENDLDCEVCAGIFSIERLQHVTAATVKALSASKYDKEEVKTFCLAFTVPGSCLLRQHAFASKYMCNPRKVDVRERLAAHFAPAIETAIGARHETRNAAFEIRITIKLANIAECCARCYNCYENLCYTGADTQYLKQCDDSFADEESIENRTQLERFLRGSGRVLAIPFEFRWRQRPDISFDVIIERKPVYVAGRYVKWCRRTPQTSVIARETEPISHFAAAHTSVRDEIVEPLVKAMRADSSRFVAAGREDVDVRMLGNGRPFVVTLCGAATVTPCEQLSNIFNGEHFVQPVNGTLTYVTDEDTAIIRDGEVEKDKHYLARVRFLCGSVTAAQMRRVHETRDVRLTQKTPIRVIQGRSMLDRAKEIRALYVVDWDAEGILMRLWTSAGTYIKEFVNGDFGRTRPSLADIINEGAPQEHAIRCELESLDVIAVDLPWPPKKRLKNSA